jgi:hypothetical protein
MQDTGKFRTNTKDQFFTKETVATECVNTVLEMYSQTRDYYWVEPSVGSGAFYKAVPVEYSKIGIDIDPHFTPSVQCDFLQWAPSSRRKIILFGNPPFGRQSSLAKAFISHGSAFADLIAFILPKSFTKPSMFKAFPLKFHLTYEKELAKNSFEVDGNSYDVPCVFQIWEKRETDRPVPLKIEARGFNYVKSNQPHDIVFRRVGANAGKCNQPGDFSEQSHYFIKFDEHYTQYTQSIRATINSHTFPSNTVGPRSLSKPEVNQVINKVLAEIS